MTSSPSTPRLRITLALFVVVLALVAVSERRWATGLAGEALHLAGLACIAGAALGRVWSSVFIAGYKDASLVRSGPYAALRHPLYALSLLAAVGVGSRRAAPRSRSASSPRSARSTLPPRAARTPCSARVTARRSTSIARGARVPAAMVGVRGPGSPRDPPARAVEILPRRGLAARLLRAASLRRRLQLAGVTPTWLVLP